MPSTWSITCHYMQHYPIACSITCQLHDQLHDSLHTLLPNITCIAWHEISWAHDPVFPAPPSTAKESSSLSAGSARDSRRLLRRLMRGLRDRVLLSCPEHENTGLESVRIIKSPHLFLWSTSDRLHPDHWERKMDGEIQDKTWAEQFQPIAKWNMGGAIPAHG